MNILFPDRSFSFCIGTHSFSGRFPVPSQEAAISIALARRLQNLPLESLPAKTVYYERACLTLGHVLSHIPKSLAKYQPAPERTIKLKARRASWEARPLPPAQATLIDIATAHYLGTAPLHALSQEAYALALIAISLNTVLESEIDWLEQADSGLAVELYQSYQLANQRLLRKIKAEDKSPSIAAKLDWHILDDREYVLEVYGTYLDKYEAFRRGLKKNRGGGQPQARLAGEPAQPLPAQAGPQPKPDRASLPRTKGAALQARILSQP